MVFLLKNTHIINRTKLNRLFHNILFSVQVQAAVKQIVGDSYSSENRHVTVIIYNDKAKVGQFTEQNYKEVHISSKFN